jgi:hypothetical protein
MEWTTVTMQVTTPLFNGGADPDGKAGFRSALDAGVRVASIRGAMRFWFRALAGSMAGPDLAALARAERAVFGGITDQRGNDDAAVSSSLILRLPDPPQQVDDNRFLSGGNRAGLRYLLGLGLMKPRTGGADLVRPYVPPSEEGFQLKIGFRHDKRTKDDVREAVETLTFASLWLMCTYGGIGARTHRGLGGVRITEVSGRLPSSWTAENLLTPGLPFYERATWLRPQPDGVPGIFSQHLPALMGTGVRVPRGPLGDWAQPPTFPVIAMKHAPVVLSKASFRSWEETLNYAGEQWRLFRANRPDDDEDARDRLRVRTAEWNNVILRRQTGLPPGKRPDFPLGALGLPVGFQDKKSGQKYEVNAAVPKDPKPDEPLRRASPVWLRAVGCGRSWRLFSFAFQSQFLPGSKDARVYLLPDKELTVRQQHVTELTGQWLAAQRNGDDFTTVIRT